MGKGGGCCASKKRSETAITDQDNPNPDRDNLNPAQNNNLPTPANPSPPLKKLKIFIIFYSMYGHIEILARRMKKGVDSIDGVEGVLYRVAETLPMEVLEQMRVPQKEDGDDVAVVSADELETADGFLFGFPTRFGSMASQMKAFFDSTGGLWKEQKLAGVPAGFFVSTGTQGGGQETTA